MDPSLCTATVDSKPHWDLGHCIYNPLEQGELFPHLWETKRDPEYIVELRLAS